MRRASLWVTLSALIVCAIQAAAAGPLTVMVSIPPQIEIVKRIGGPTIVVEALIPPGRSPTTYEPSPRQLAALANADMLIPVGVPFERQVMRRIRTIAPALSLCGAQALGEHADFQSSPENEATGSAAHDHGSGPDPHFWLDPKQALEHADTICDCLCTRAPEDCDSFHSRLEAYRLELETIDEEVARQLAPLAGATMLVFHPAFGHFAHRYGLHQLAIEHDGKEPGARYLADVINRAESLGTRALFVQPQIVAPSIRAVADAIGATVVNLDPLAPDLSANIQRIADTVARELGKPVGAHP